jgi:multidrug efflux pump subunit AcrA (membrane-fusion protein)
MTIDNLSSLQVVAGFAEADAASIAVGQGATVTLAALPDTEVTGRVIAVSPTSTVVSNVVTYDVTIAMIGSPATVKDGMTADVSIIVAVARNVLELPNAAITTVGTTSTVQLVEGSSTVTTDVTIGLVGESDTQITSGLKAGDKVHEAAATSTGATGASTSAGASGFGGFGGGGGLGGAGRGGLGGG